jgi:hypothetical protein
MNEKLLDDKWRKPSDIKSLRDMMSTTLPHSVKAVQISQET